MAGCSLWACTGSYPPRPGNEVDILLDGRAACREISAAFCSAVEYIYMTISCGAQDLLLVPESGGTLLDILRSRQKAGVDVRMVVWQPVDINTPHTIPDPGPNRVPGVNEGPGSIQARWDHAKGYYGFYESPRGLFEPRFLAFPSSYGCHHQNTFMMDDGGKGCVAFVGCIDPVRFYRDTPMHDVSDVRRVAKGEDPIGTLEENPPLHGVFYKIQGPAVADVVANFVERYNCTNIPYRDVTSDVAAPAAMEEIPEMPGGIEVQVVRTIAPRTYPTTKKGDRGIRELYFNMLSAAEAGSLVYIENQCLFDHGIVAEIYEVAERGAGVIAVLTAKPDTGTLHGQVEGFLGSNAQYRETFPLLSGHDNVALLTLGYSRLDPRDKGKTIGGQTHIHSKNMAVIGDRWAMMTGGSANIAFTSMWFHSEMNIAFTDIARIKNWVARLWKEHLQVPLEKAMDLVEKPAEALDFFRRTKLPGTAGSGGREKRG